MLFIPEQPFLPAVNPAPEDAHRESLWFPFSGQTLLVGESGEKAALLSGTPRILGNLPILVKARTPELRHQSESFARTVH